MYLPKKTFADIMFQYVGNLAVQMVCQQLCQNSVPRKENANLDFFEVRPRTTHTFVPYLFMEVRELVCLHENSLGDVRGVCDGRLHRATAMWHFENGLVDGLSFRTSGMRTREQIAIVRNLTMVCLSNLSVQTM